MPASFLPATGKRHLQLPSATVARKARRYALKVLSKYVYYRQHYGQTVGRNMLYFLDRSTFFNHHCNQLEIVMFCPPSRLDNLSPQQRVTLEWDGMAGEWDDLAKGYAAGLFPYLVPYFAERSDMIALDFGCATGVLTEKLCKVAEKVLAIDVSTKMMDILQDKILSCEWNNVTPLCAVFANLNDTKERTGAATAKQLLEAYYGQVDLIVASSVMTCIPEQDLQATMQVIGKLLKPSTGRFVHSDWPKSEAHHPHAMTEENAQNMYAMGGLQPESMRIIDLNVNPSETIPIFLGVAKKL